MKRMSTGDVGWLAGIIEGEGWFVTNRSTGPLVCVAMTDFDVIERIHAVTGVGRLNRRTMKDKKDQLTWVVGKRSEVEAICYLILPFLGERRSVKVLEVLAFAEDLDAAAEHRKHFFVCGHPATPENTYVVGRDSRPGPSRMCRECALQKTGARNKRKHEAIRAARSDVCAREGCDNPMTGRHMNARFCCQDCATADRIARRQAAKAVT